MKRIKEFSAAASANGGGNTALRTAVAGIITTIQRIMTKRGDPMLFVTLEDLSGSMEVLVFSEALSKNPTLWQEGKAILVRGRLSTRNDEPKFICDEAIAL